MISKFFILLGNIWNKENLFCIHVGNAMLPFKTHQLSSLYFHLYFSFSHSSKITRATTIEPLTLWGKFNMVGQPWAQLNFKKNLLRRDRMFISSPGNDPVHIISMQEQKPKHYSRMEEFCSIFREPYYCIFYKFAFVYMHFSCR